MSSTRMHLGALARPRFRNSCVPCAQSAGVDGESSRKEGPRHPGFVPRHLSAVERQTQPSLPEMELPPLTGLTIQRERRVRKMKAPGPAPPLARRAVCLHHALGSECPPAGRGRSWPSSSRPLSTGQSVCVHVSVCARVQGGDAVTRPRAWILEKRGLGTNTSSPVPSHLPSVQIRCQLSHPEHPGDRAVPDWARSESVFCYLCLRPDSQS